ncbi:YraN family protein [Chloroflexota bacterium]
MTKHNQQVGAWGEDQAAVWLASRGYEVMRRNVRTPYGEIDIVAQKGNIIIFVEVKTLTSSKAFYPEQQITARKREHMLNSAMHYAAENEVNHWQIDVIAVEGKPGGMPVVHHFEGVQ